MTKHKPVLLKEAIDGLYVKSSETYIDVTLGGGGHSADILERLGDFGRLIVFDVDENAIDNFKSILKEKGFKQSGEGLEFTRKNVEVVVIKENFRNIDKALEKHGIKQVAGIIADLGLSTDQIYGVEGISFLKNEKLDMRFDKAVGATAADLLNGLYKKELVDLFKRLADIEFANELANEIVRARTQRPLTTTSQLKHLIQKVVPLHKRKGTNRNPEAKVFQALRIAVNDELGSLRTFLPLAFEALASGGRLSVISFHSGEDRLMKNFISEKSKDNQLKVVDKLLRPTREEIVRNPRSSSAKLRVVEKL